VHEASGIASIAGLPRSSAIVCVGPPLLLRPAGLSCGLVLLRLPVVALNPHELSSEILKPASVIVPEQLPPALLAARIVFLKEPAEPKLTAPPEPAPPEEPLPEKVELVTVSVKSVLLSMAPPEPAEELPEKVLLVTVKLEKFSTAPPEEPALLPEKVELVTVKVPWF
jgi:hypothetical protein